jgi:hypothetical protein
VFTPVVGKDSTTEYEEGEVICPNCGSEDAEPSWAGVLRRDLTKECLRQADGEYSDHPVEAMPARGCNVRKHESGESGGTESGATSCAPSLVVGYATDDRIAMPVPHRSGSHVSLAHRSGKPRNAEATILLSKACRQSLKR